MYSEEGIYNYTFENGNIVQVSTGEIVDLKEIKSAFEKNLCDEFIKTHQTALKAGIELNIRLVKDKRGQQYFTTNVKENFHFVKVFKVDVRDALETHNLSIFARGFLYTCLAYLHFPSNTLNINGQSPTNELLCEKLNVGKTKLYEIYKELEKYEIIKRKKINGQMVIYLNPFLHSCGLVDIETYNLFETSVYNPNVNK